MNQQAKRAIHAAMNRAVDASAITDLVRQRPGYWVRQIGPGITWEVETLFESEHGAGMFRVGWCLRDSGVPAVLDLLDLPGTEHGTIGGDLGSLVQRKRGMTMLCLDGVGTGFLGRMWWGTPAESPDALTDRTLSWLKQVGPTFMELGNRRSLADFVDTFGQSYGNVEVHPETEAGRHKAAIALHALDGDADWVGPALESWELSTSSQQLHDYARDEQQKFVRRVRALVK